MEQKINERIHALRMLFKPQPISAFIIPSTDPHLSEYVAPHWETRKWISGFTGSAGTVVILPDKAGLWTDSRYFLQAADELKNTEIILHKEMLPETPTLIEYLCQNLQPGEKVGIDGNMFSVSQVEQLSQLLKKRQIELEITGDLIGEIWQNRPPMPDTPAFIYDLKYAGRSCKEKIETTRIKNNDKSPSRSRVKTASKERRNASGVRSSESRRSSSSSTTRSSTGSSSSRSSERR